MHMWGGPWSWDFTTDSYWQQLIWTIVTCHSISECQDVGPGGWRREMQSRGTWTSCRWWRWKGRWSEEHQVIHLKKGFSCHLYLDWCLFHFAKSECSKVKKAKWFHRLNWNCCKMGFCAVTLSRHWWNLSALLEPLCSQLVPLVPLLAVTTNMQGC